MLDKLGWICIDKDVKYESNVKIDDSVYWYFDIIADYKLGRVNNGIVESDVGDKVVSFYGEVV